MSSIGTGYDLAASTFSPDGRIFQIEYAQKAVDNSGTVIGLRGKDGVVLAAEKILSTKLHEPTTCSRLGNVNANIGFAAGGHYPDAKALLRFCQEQALEYFGDYRSYIPPYYMADLCAQYIHVHTLNVLRPFGNCVFIASWAKDDGPKLFMIEPSGLFYGYQGWAVGKHRQAAKTEIEKLKLKDMGMQELVKEAAHIIMAVRDDTKDKNYKLELSWVGKNTDGKHKIVDEATAKAAIEWATAKLNEDDEMQ